MQEYCRPSELASLNQYLLRISSPIRMASFHIPLVLSTILYSLDVFCLAVRCRIITLHRLIAINYIYFVIYGTTQSLFWKYIKSLHTKEGWSNEVHFTLLKVKESQQRKFNRSENNFVAADDKHRSVSIYVRKMGSQRLRR